MCFTLVDQSSKYQKPDKKAIFSGTGEGRAGCVSGVALDPMESWVLALLLIYLKYVF